MMTGTVVTTVYNGLRHVERYCNVVQDALHAGAQVTWMLFDDGSSDGTPDAVAAELARREMDGCVEVVRLGRLGRARALNAAVTRVSTPVFYIHDFDDVSLPARFAAQAALLECHARVGCVGGGYMHVNADTGAEETRSLRFDPVALAARFPLYVPFPHTFMAFRTDAVRAVGGYPLWDDYEEMGLLAALLQNAWQIASVPEVLGRHYIYQQSYFERQFGFTRRRWRNLKRQLAMRREFPCIKVSRTLVVARFLYNFVPGPAKAVIRRAAGYAA